MPESNNKVTVRNIKDFRQAKESCKAILKQYLSGRFKMESMHLSDTEAWFPAYTSETIKWFGNGKAFPKCLTTNIYQETKGESMQRDTYLWTNKNGELLLKDVWINIILK